MSINMQLQKVEIWSGSHDSLYVKGVAWSDKTTENYQATVVLPSVFLLAGERSGALSCQIFLPGVGEDQNRA